MRENEREKTGKNKKMTFYLKQTVDGSGITGFMSELVSVRYVGIGVILEWKLVSQMNVTFLISRARDGIYANFPYFLMITIFTLLLYIITV